MNSFEVSLSSGAVRGLEENGIRIFRGIPYAAAPIGDRRFAAPQPVETWDNVLDATEFRKPSLQPAVVGNSAGIVGNEDCLFLNVYSPAASVDCPVMVWIHPGGGVVGSANQCDGAPFARDGVVVVTFAYRLGALGLLYLPDIFNDVADCNFALLDMVAALRWVNENIASFGGDPNRVTVAGVSNGGRNVVTLLATPSARGLFRQAIVMSGTGGGYIVADTDEARRVTGEVLFTLGLDFPRASALRNVSGRDIVAAQTVVGQSMATLLPFKAVVDGSILAQRPIDAIRSGAVQEIPLLVGTNRDEFDFFAMQANYRVWVESRTSMVAQDQSLAAALIEYRRLRPAFWRDEDVQRDVMTSSEWWIPAIRLAESHAALGGPVWMYRLDWRILPRGQGVGAPHGLDLPLMCPDDPFHAIMLAAALERSSQLEPVLDQMHAAIVRFVSNGAPCGTEWPNYDVESRDTYIFDDHSTLVSDPDRDLRLVWSTLLL